jgi:hypothetical protein
VTVVEDLEGRGLLAVDVGHELLVGESLEAGAGGVGSIRHRINIRCGNGAGSLCRHRSGRGPEGAGRGAAVCARRGALLALLGVLGFFYDAGFSTGTDLSADDVAGIIVVNGWRNVLYLLTGLLALGFAARRPRPTAAALGGFYLVLGIWGLLETDHDIGSILQILPLTDSDNLFHLVIGGLGTIAALVDGPLPRPKQPERKRGEPKRKPKVSSRPARVKPKG